MQKQPRSAILALTAAGTLWGLNVPLSKLALGWGSPGAVATVRFAVAIPLLALLGRRRLREALSLPILASGALGFGLVIVLQNAGIARTSVTHAAVLLGAVPVLVALTVAGLERKMAGPTAWGGYGLALIGVTLVAGGHGSGASVRGDLLVLVSAAISAACIAVQPRLLRERDPAAVTAMQFAGGLIVALPAALLEHAPATAGRGGPAATTAIVALALLATTGTALPFWLFAYGQIRVPAELAGTFVNLEPLVGAAVGWLAFGDVAATGQIAGAVAVLGGIAIGTRADGGRSEPIFSGSDGVRSPRARRRLRGRLRRGAGAGGAGPGAPEPPRGMALGDVHGQRRRRLPAGLPDHPLAGAAAALRLPAAAARHRLLRRPDHLLRDAARAAEDARWG